MIRRWWQRCRQTTPHEWVGILISLNLSHAAADWLAGEPSLPWFIVSFMIYATVNLTYHGLVPEEWFGPARERG